ncbi:MAG: hypothetical protein C0490_24925, partial [Marivirga sp.]|nr:hypothetical protein [Marivirga sp.]
MMLSCIAIGSFLLLICCEPEETFEVTTLPVTDITPISAISGGVVSDGADIVSRGICWSAMPNPTIDLPTKTSEGSGMGSFASKAEGLSGGVMYYVRAYASNGSHTIYGEQVEFTTGVAMLPTVGILSISP